MSPRRRPTAGESGATTWASRCAYSVPLDASGGVAAIRPIVVQRLPTALTVASYSSTSPDSRTTSGAGSGIASPSRRIASSVAPAGATNPARPTVLPTNRSSTWKSARYVVTVIAAASSSAVRWLMRRFPTTSRNSTPTTAAGSPIRVGKKIARSSPYSATASPAMMRLVDVPISVAAPPRIEAFDTAM